MFEVKEKRKDAVEDSHSMGEPLAWRDVFPIIKGPPTGSHKWSRQDQLLRYVRGRIDQYLIKEGGK